MKVVNELRLPNLPHTPVMLAAGFFDGVHRGHHTILTAAIKSSREQHGQSWVLSFDRHPMSLLNPERCPPLLTTSRERLQLFENLGLDGCIMLEFNQHFAQLPPTEFIRELTSGIPSLSQIYIGPNWRFGHRAQGTPELLKTYAARHDFIVNIAAPVEDDAGIISSTRIRTAILHGSIDTANQLLGRHYTIHGTVIKGHQIGRKLGYPTANISTYKEVIPPSGIYAGIVSAGKTRCKAVIYIGYRKTFPDIPTPKKPAIEAHLLDFCGDLYDQKLQLEFIQRLRGDIEFPSPQALQDQIAQDVVAARNILEQLK